MKLAWDGDQFDEIGLIFEKGEKDAEIGKMLEEMESTALLEAETACSNGGILAAEVGNVLTPFQFECMPDIDKETAIKMLALKGYGKGLSSDKTAYVITMEFSPLAKYTMASTFFEIINRIEKLDGMYNTMISPEWKLNLIVPVECAKGLFKYQMLITKLYPWITSISESRVNVIAPVFTDPTKTSAESNANSVDNNNSDDNKSGKKPFWKRIFGKR